MTVVGAVLCGGSSRRMGHDKSLLIVEGQILAARVGSVLERGGAGSVIAVGGNRAALAAAGLEVVADRWPGEGPLGGILTALDSSRPPTADASSSGTDALVVAACDLPLLADTDVRQLVGHLRDDAVDGAFAVIDGHRQYQVLVLRRRAADRLRAAFESGERSLRGALRNLVMAEVEGLPSDHFADADTPEAFERLTGRRPR